jgi:alpha-glucosidase
MNYHGFTRPVQTFLSNRDPWGLPAPIDAADLDRWLIGVRAQLPFPVQLSQLNLLDSHDTPRLLTSLGGDTRLLRLAVVALFSYRISHFFPDRPKS